MGKGSSSKAGGRPRSSKSAPGAPASCWGPDRHADREAKNVSSFERRRLKKKEKKKKKRGRNDDDDDDENGLSYKRTALSHDTAGKIDESRLRLHIARARREVDKERERLRAWDDVEERRREEAEERERRRTAEEEEADKNDGGGEGAKKKKRGRAGPETWKLRGAARPAWEVYDFDTRYVDPHLKEHEEARARAGRVRNVLSLYRGRFGEEEGGGGSADDGPPQPHCRRFLSLLMQLGHLCVEARKFRAAREAFLEAMELEGTGEGSVVATTARSRLMRMYLEANRPDSARRLWERIPHDTSAWVRYSAALVEYVSWRLLREGGSTRGTAESLLLSAVESNPFCAYSLAFHGTFRRVVEYGDEVEDADPGTLEEAIEYCHSEQMGSWFGTDGALDWVRGVVLRLLNGGKIAAGEEEKALRAKARLESWEGALNRIEEEFEASQTMDPDIGEETAECGVGDKTESNSGEDKGDEDEPDILMYAGMFRTAMDMISDAGELLKVEDEMNSEDD